MSLPSDSNAEKAALKMGSVSEFIITLYKLNLISTKDRVEMIKSYWSRLCPF